MALDLFRSILPRKQKESPEIKQPPVSRTPIGAGDRKPYSQEEIPVVEVQNEVIWVNPVFAGRVLPFRLKEGEPTRFGIFATGNSDTSATETAEGKLSEHSRSLTMSRAVFGDAEGRLYRDVDVKGVGHMQRTGFLYRKVEAGSIERKKDDSDTFGILELAAAHKDASFAEEFISLGIRTYRVIAIIKLKELVQNGRKCSIDEAKEWGIISRDSEPAVSVRAFGTRARIEDIYYYRSHPHPPSPKPLDDAIRMVAQELGKEPSTFGEKEYFRWFVDTLAKNVARMHKAGFVHKNLIPHNITLDCRIVDLDTVVPGPKVPLEAFRDIIDGVPHALCKGKGVSFYRFDFETAYHDSLANLNDALQKHDFMLTRLRKDFRGAYLQEMEKGIS